MTSAKTVDKKTKVRYADSTRQIRRLHHQKELRKKDLVSFSEKALRREIMQEARLLRMHEGVAEIMARRVSVTVGEWARTRKNITRTELNARIIRELRVYSPDLAFLYQNHGKII